MAIQDSAAVRRDGLIYPGDERRAEQQTQSITQPAFRINLRNGVDGRSKVALGSIDRQPGTDGI